MNALLFVMLWVAVEVLHVGLGIHAYWRRKRLAIPGRPTTLIVSAIAAILPIITLILVIVVFAIGGTHPIRQLNKEASQWLWHVWVLLFLPTCCAMPIAIVAAMVTVMLPPYPPREWSSFAFRLLTVGTSVWSCYVLKDLFPRT